MHLIKDHPYINQTNQNNVNEPQSQQLQLPPPLTCVACLQHVRRPLQRSADSLREHFAALLDRPVPDLSPVEHAALLVGSFELLHHPEIPYRVVINEAVELAKTFGGTDGFRYVNGVLDKVAARLRPAEVTAR